MSTLDDAIRGDVKAIEQNFREMMGALYGLDVTKPEHKDFVDSGTLDALAKLVFRKCTAHASPEPGKIGNEPEGIGQEITAHLQRAVPHPFAKPSDHAGMPKYRTRTMVTLMNGKKGKTESFFVLILTTALHAWARARLVGAKP